MMFMQSHIMTATDKSFLEAAHAFQHTHTGRSPTQISLSALEYMDQLHPRSDAGVMQSKSAVMVAQSHVRGWHTGAMLMCGKEA